MGNSRMLVHGGLALVAAAGCISTDLTPTGGGSVCLSGPPDFPPQASLVDISMEIDGFFDHCPGVVVAPSLVATAASCVFPLVGEWLPSNAGRECDGGGAWPAERGSFSEWIGRAYEVADLDIYTMTDPARPFHAQRIYGSGAPSRCSDDLALVFVPGGLPAPSTPMRLEESSSIGEPVSLLSLEFVQGMLTPRITAAAVQEITGETGDDLVPPRSLLLDRRACAFARGGGVFSAETGALIGVIFAGIDACDAPEGKAIAVRLAPWRRFILDAAADALSGALAVERESDSSGAKPCLAEN